MARVKPLVAAALCRKTDPKIFSFKTTADISIVNGLPGQERAIEAVKFGIGIKRSGYNLFAIGPTGAGKQTLVRKFVAAQAETEPVPDDWCYVYNFDEPHRPRALRLPAARGLPFQKHMQQFIDDLQVTIPAAFDLDENRARFEALEAEFKEKTEKAFNELQEKANAKHIVLVRTPMGMALAPSRNGEVLSPDEFQKLPAAAQDSIRQEIDVLQKELQDILRQIPRWEAAHRERARELNREITKFAVAHLIEKLQSVYADIPAITEHLTDVQQDILEHAHQFLTPRPMAQVPGQQDQPDAAAFTGRYGVNVLCCHEASGGAPVIYENHPVHGNLIGRIEHVSQYGALMTDFTLIKAGALHRANGGYLILDAKKILMQPYAWEELKRTIKSGEIRTDGLSQSMSLVSTVSLEPEPIPLDVKIILLGDRYLYYMLSSLDPEFLELFKVEVDIEDRVDRTPEMAASFSIFVASLIEEESLKPVNRKGVARVLDRAARLAADAEKLSCHAEDIADLLREADYWAGEAGSSIINEKHLQTAIDAQIRRSDRARERTHEAIHRGTVLIDTAGEVVGQANGLSVLQLGGFAFGQPSRITATVQLGKGDVVDIERQVDLGGPLHSKGVLILSGFLGKTFGADRPLPVRASLVFEQSYGGVDGDSASSAELYTLLSALSGVPIKQCFAVTGSVNQHGRVQAIGGVNEKIEGFFDVCAKAGLSGEQGVLIPESNVKHLMLRDDIVQAARARKFRIFPIATIEEGIEIMTGVPAGTRGKSGKYPAKSIYGKVESRLDELTRALKNLSAKDAS